MCQADMERKTSSDIHKIMKKIDDVNMHRILHRTVLMQNEFTIQQVRISMSDMKKYVLLHVLHKFKRKLMYVRM